MSGIDVIPKYLVMDTPTIGKAAIALLSDHAHLPVPVSDNQCIGRISIVFTLPHVLCVFLIIR